MNFNFDNKYYKIFNYNKNETIKNEGDVCDSIGIVIKGTVKISNFLINDTEFVISILEENDIFGENLMFSSNNFYPGYIYATTNASIMFIKKDAFIELLSIDNDFKLYYLRYISNKFIELQTRIKILSQPTIKEKFLFYLRLSSKKTGSCYIKSITKLANYLNVPRPSLSRSISELIDENKIIVNNKYYKIKQGEE